MELGFFQAIVRYSDSIVKLWCGYLISILIFVIYELSCRKDRRLGKKDNRKRRVIFNVLIVLPIAITAGIRSPWTGADTHGYVELFEHCKDDSFLETLKKDYTTILFYILAWVTCRLTNGNTPLFLTLVSFITTYFFVSGIEKWKVKYCGTAMLAFCALFGPIMLDQARQFLAVSILFYAYWFLVHDEHSTYWKWVVLAMLFHLTAFFAAVLISVVHDAQFLKQKNIAYYAVLILATFGIRFVLEFLGFFLEVVGIRYQIYFITIEREGVGLGLLQVTLATVFPVLLLQEWLDKRNELRNTICLTLPARVAGYYSHFLYRMFYYFSSECVIAFPMALENIDRKNRAYVRAFIIVVCLVYFFTYYGWKLAEVYFPYSTCFQT